MCNVSKLYYQYQIVFNEVSQRLVKLKSYTAQFTSLRLQCLENTSSLRCKFSCNIAHSIAAALPLDPRSIAAASPLDPSTIIHTMRCSGIAALFASGRSNVAALPLMLQIRSFRNTISRNKFSSFSSHRIALCPKPTVLFVAFVALM